MQAGPGDERGVDGEEVRHFESLAHGIERQEFETGHFAVLVPGREAGREHDVGSTLVVEWRALTVALLDRLAEIVRQRLRKDALSFPLARVLQGGTWAAGRAIARERRPDGSPPIKVVSDGTVF